MLQSRNTLHTLSYVKLFVVVRQAKWLAYSQRSALASQQHRCVSWGSVIRVHHALIRFVCDVQMTLNTFHHAGLSTKNVTLGIPRLEVCLPAAYVSGCVNVQ